MSELPDWVTQTPSLSSLHTMPAQEATPFELPFSWEDLMEIGQELIEQFLKRVVQAVVGVFIPGEGSFEQLQDWAESIPGLSQILDIIDGLDLPDIDDLLGILPNLLGQIFSGDAEEAPNRLPAGDFPDGSITANVQWLVDLAKSRTSGGTGAAKVIADGSLKALRSGSSPTDTISVSAGSAFTASIFVSHEDYTGTGQAVLLQVVPFTGDTAGQPVTMTTTVAANPNDPTAPTTLPAAYTPTSPDLAWPGYELTGSYTVPEGVTGVQTRILVTENATGGTFWFDDASAKQLGKLRKEWVDGLPDALDDLLGRFQLIIDTILSALTKLPVVGGTLDDLFQMLGIIPSDNVTGAAGPATMFESFFGLIDAFLGGSVGAPGSSGGSLADVTNVAGQVASQSAQGAFAWEIVNMLNNTPVARGMLATGRANYDLPSANTFVPTTQAAALSSSFGLMQAMPIGVISWYGYGTSGITSFYINIRKVNPSTGARELVHHSGNLVGDLQPGSTAADGDWMFYTLPTPIAGLATDNYYVEWVPVGGTHHIRGMSFTDDIKDHPVAATPSYGTTVDYTSNPNTPATSLAKATSGPDVAWVEYAVSLGDVDDFHEPRVFSFDQDGESLPIPAWCNRVDAIPLGGGGDGHDGLTLGVAGEPGEPGKFAPITWARGTDFTGDTTITFNDVDGAAQLSIPGHDTLGAKGADGAGTKFGLTPIGRGPGVLEYNGQTYTGGGDQKVTGAAGTDPGGGGNGGNGLFFQQGGPGGKPVGWVCFRQVEVEGETPEGDITPPTPPTTVGLVEATYSTLTFTVSGGSDA